jgi:cytidylate kinase
MIITIARECGSGGEVVGRLLAKKYDIPLYGWKTLVQMAKDEGIYEENPTFFTEDPVNTILYAITYTASINHVKSMPKEALRRLFEKEDCILVGRCGNVIFRDRPDAVSVFLHAPLQSRIAAMVNVWDVSMDEAARRVPKTDEYRALYHKYYTGEQWGLSKYYDLTLDTKRLGFETTASLIESYISSIDLSHARSL